MAEPTVYERLIQAPPTPVTDHYAGPHGAVNVEPRVLGEALRLALPPALVEAVYRTVQKLEAGEFVPGFRADELAEIAYEVERETVRVRARAAGACRWCGGTAEDPMWPGNSCPDNCEGWSRG